MLEKMEEECQSRQPQLEGELSLETQAPPQLLQLDIQCQSNGQPEEPSNILSLSNPKGAGRKPGSRNRQPEPEALLQAELLEMLKLARQAREFAQDALKTLVEAASGADSIKTKMQIAEMAVGLTERLTKTAGSIIEQLKKQLPPSGKEDGRDDFDLQKWLEGLKKG